MSQGTIAILERNVYECERQLREAWSKNTHLREKCSIAEKIISCIDSGDTNQLSELVTQYKQH